MNQTAIILIIILLLGIFLFSILGEKMKEGMQGTFSGTFNTKNSSSKNENSPTSSSNSSGSSTASSVNYDNYNHYTQSSTQLTNGTTFYGQNGGNIVVSTNSDGTQTLTVTLANGQTPMVFTNVQPATNNQTNSTVETYTNYTTSTGGTANTFYGPMGDQATVVKTSTGQQAINVQTSDGSYTFTSDGYLYNPNNTSSSTQYYGSTGTPIQTSTNSLAYDGPYGSTAGSVTGPQGNTAYYAQGPNGNTVYGTTNSSSNQYYGPNGGTAGSVTGPQGNTAYYAQGPNGNTAVTSSYPNTYDYSTSLPPGIPKSMIPPGQEDLYILKTEVVPPVCPACLSAGNTTENKCPPCPACARCPEPSITCKAVPNYNAINDQFLPQPVLNDFSQFGM